MPRWSVEDLYRIKGRAARERSLDSQGTQARVTVHMGTCGISSGADKVYAALAEELAASNSRSIALATSGCAGICNREPLITVEKAGQEAVKYADVTVDTARRIFREHVLEDRLPGDLALVRGWEQPEKAFDGAVPEAAAAISTVKDLPFFSHQELRVMRNRGLISADSLEEYIEVDGYFGAAKALFQMTPREIVAEVKSSGLRGRGGAGFPTGLKWEFAAASKSEVKYVLCNADEGDPGAFMDRCVLESDPHSVIEGMIIAARAIGSDRGYIYCRAEYPLAVKTLNQAIDQAREHGLLGHDILGSGFNFDLEVYRGAGAFVCGEETALMTSIEGKRGTPRPRPPFPAVSGLWKKPTILNNVETLSSIPQIILKGARWFKSVGTPRSQGTKVFALTGDVKNVGLVEVPMGISLGTIINDIGGGIPKGKKFKAVQLGGPSGGCVPLEHLGASVDYETIPKLGAIVGSGGMIVMDEDKCMVDVARFFMEFCVDESCGKCAPCRVGTRQMLEILTRICNGQGREGDIETLEKWAEIIQNTALCGLGQTAPNPVLSTLRYFRDEYEAHIKEKRCPAVACAALFRSPCQHACPLGMDVPTYVALVREERLEEAYRVLLRTNPFPSVCGRVCDHKCESKCRRQTLDESVHVKYLKRYITDNGPRPRAGKATVTRLEKVAVIGGGPSGLSAAWELAQRGYMVVVYEALPEAGGMLRYGIPDYRLPRQVLKSEIEAIVGLGVELRTGVTVGRDISWEDLDARYAAIYVAVGAQKSTRLRVEGENRAGVMGAVEFLRKYNLGQRPEVGQSVVVVGGGNTAVDSARTALRLGAKEVTILYRREREDMPAQEEEIAAAVEEGINLITLSAPARLTGANGHVEEVVCQRMGLGDYDASGRRKPLPVPGAEFTLKADTVISAIGQQVDPGFREQTAGHDSGVEFSPQGLVAIRPGTKTRTGEAMVFAGGDAVTGPGMVVWAIHDGIAAAGEIDAAIRARNGEPAWQRPAPEPIALPTAIEEEVRESKRSAMPELPARERRNDFREVELGFDAKTALAEACRCLRCDISEAVD